MYLQKAILTIEQSISPLGLLASCNAVDNYARIWSRDSAMTGIAGLLCGNERITESLKNSIFTLASMQLQNGQIPTNVFLREGKLQASYGTSVGRVDATTWWVIASCIYIRHVDCIQTKNKLEKQIFKALEILQSWEYNNRGLLYTPLGGNWADEYISSGYTLYDNSLYYWAIKLVAKLYENILLAEKAAALKNIIQSNFTTFLPNEMKYHKPAYQSLSNKLYPYMLSDFSPSGYNTQWDMAGNALALVLELNNHTEELVKFLSALQQKYNHWMLPVFDPVITKDDWQWNLLENNYAYQFKNKPHHFHNGGSWPIFLGWLCMGLQKTNNATFAKNITNNYEQLMAEHTAFNFNEYWSTDNLQPSGVNNLCFSASGYIYMTQTANNSNILGF
jgi:hypothetical protein